MSVVAPITIPAPGVHVINAQVTSGALTAHRTAIASARREALSSVVPWPRSTRAFTPPTVICGRGKPPATALTESRIAGVV